MWGLLRNCTALCLVIYPLASLAGDVDPSLDSVIVHDVEATRTQDCCPPVGCEALGCIQWNGFFAGVGASYNSVKLNQNLYGADLERLHR